MNTSSSGTAKTSPQNDFKPFAVGEGANVIEQSEYEKSGFLKEGFKKGMARSSEINKAIRQGSSIAAAVARFAASKTDEALLDNGDIDTLSRQIETAISSVSSLLVAEADGSADALTAHFTPEVKELENGLTVHVRAKEKNTGASPSFNADETGAKPVVKGNNLPLEAADIAGAGHWLEMQYDGALDKWVLQNPAKGITPPSGVPVGTIEYFAMTTPPAGYLKADGAVVGRQTYPELFETIGTTFGEGDGETTFNLPDLINRFAQGSHTPGQKIGPGLPNINGGVGVYNSNNTFGSTKWHAGNCPGSGNSTSYGGEGGAGYVEIDASGSNPIYGASDTVQPPALTLLPCIKAFDAATNPGLVDITALANEMAGKADKSQVANLSMPAQSVRLTFPSAHTDYTAPADGYFYMCMVAGSSTGHINLYNTSFGFGTMLTLTPGLATKAYLPIKKSDVCRVSWSNADLSASVNEFFFVYCVGSKP